MADTTDPTRPDDRPLATWPEFFAAFHRLWGLSAAGLPYRKKLWTRTAEFLERQAQRAGCTQRPPRARFCRWTGVTPPQTTRRRARRPRVWVDDTGEYASRQYETELG